MNIKANLKSIVTEANAFLADISVFTILSINNPVDKCFDRIPGKGYYLTAAGIFTVLGFYSRIYCALKYFEPKELTGEKLEVIEKIRDKITTEELKSYFICKEPSSMLVSDEDCFIRFMRDLKNNGFDLGLKKKEFSVAWKKIRNMLSHLPFPLAKVGAKHIKSNEEGAVRDLELPKYEFEEIAQILRENFASTEAFRFENKTLVVNNSVLFAYIFPIRDFLIDEIDKSNDERCKIALNSIKEIIDRQEPLRIQ